jgi:hypothetical protein
MATPIAFPVCCPLSPSTETVASDRVSAASKRDLEDIPVMPIVVAELEFRDVQRQIMRAAICDGPVLRRLRSGLPPRVALGAAALAGPAYLLSIWGCLTVSRPRAVRQ